MAQARERWAVVTGANRGIGLEVCRQLAVAGVRAILTARDGATARAAADKLGGARAGVEARPLDVTDPAGVAAFAEGLAAAPGRLDILVNNAGVSLSGFDEAVARRTLAVNVYGALAVTEALLPLMGPGARIVNVSSGMGELSALGPARQAALLDETLTREGLAALMEEFARDVAQGQAQRRGWPASAYRVSKAGLNALTRILARDLAGRGIGVNSVCPGWVRTGMGGRFAPRGPAKGAETIVWAALLPPDGPSGGFFRDRQAIGW